MTIATLSIQPVETPETGEPFPRLRVVNPPPSRARPCRTVIRGAMAVLTLGLAALVVGRAGTVLGGGPASVPGHRLGSDTYVVQPGDTLWRVAGSLAGGGNVALLVQQLSDLNGGAELRVGQRLVLP
jgi:Tfp pilus assembly protein FimV